jgi:hypothetical protein
MIKSQLANNLTTEVTICNQRPKIIVFESSLQFDDSGLVTGRF